MGTSGVGHKPVGSWRITDMPMYNVYRKFENRLFSWLTEQDWKHIDSFATKAAALRYIKTYGSIGYKYSIVYGNINESVEGTSK